MRTLIAAALLVAVPASAQTLRDDASGLSITAPPGFTATPSPPSQRENRPVFDVRSARDTDTGCRVAVAPAPANASLSQAQINAQAGTDSYRDTVAGTLATLYEVRALEPVAHGGVTGIAAIGDLRPREGMPARAQEVRSLLIILETPRQRVTLACVGEKSDFRERLPQFEAVLRGITIP
jgi:hypothetical protein